MQILSAASVAGARRHCCRGNHDARKGQQCCHRKIATEILPLQNQSRLEHERRQKDGENEVAGKGKTR